MNIRFEERIPSLQDVSARVEKLLVAADVLGELPTPIEPLTSIAAVEDFSDLDGARGWFASRLPSKAKRFFESAWQKLRGIADLRERVIYVPQAPRPRARFAKLHELGHQVLPWHDVEIECDDSRSLSPAVTRLFDREANYFAADVLFQGCRFRAKARSLAPSFDAVFTLADTHGASRHATLRRFVEDQDETIAAIPYWPCHNGGGSVLIAGKAFVSPRFLRKYADVKIPSSLAPDDPWWEPLNVEGPCQDTIALLCGGRTVRFEWHGWWNSYTLFIILRRRPFLARLGRLVR